MTRRVKIARTTRKRRRQIEERHAVVPGRKLTENEKARVAGIPKRFKQYHARYAMDDDIEALVAGHLQAPAPMLDHRRDRVGRREGMAPGCNPEDGTSRVGSIPTPPTNTGESV